MSQNHILLLTDPFDNTAYRGSVPDVSAIWQGRRGERLSTPIRVTWLSGRVFKDFIWTGAAAPLVSQRVVTLLAQSGVSGWGTFDVTVQDAEGRLTSGYWGLAITGRCSWIDFDKRKNAALYTPNRSGGETPHFRGLKYDKESWDGSDLLMDSGKTGWMLATETVRKLFTQNGVSNCRFDSLDSVEVMAQRSEILA